MKLTPQYKEHINNMTDEELLFLLRTAQLDDPLMKGETGEYIHKRLESIFEGMNEGLESE